jgi:LmbE family N-acetylglucosaminyl deacetylase
MLALKLAHASVAPPRVLCLGAHCDDIDLGCGGTLLRLREEHPDVDVRWVVFCSDRQRAREVRESAARFLQSENDKRVTTEEFRDGFLPYQGAEVKEVFERLKTEVEPDLVFTHYRHDLHQDHRLVSELTWNTFRDHLILEYEIPKWEGDLGSPNSYVNLDERHVDAKIEIMLDVYASQRDRAWFDADTFRGLLRLRGVESNAPGRFAEAFHARKLVFDPEPGGRR